jgi:hypothetical protein
MLQNSLTGTLRTPRTERVQCEVPPVCTQAFALHSVHRSAEAVLGDEDQQCQRDVEARSIRSHCQLLLREVLCILLGVLWTENRWIGQIAVAE